MAEKGFFILFYLKKQKVLEYKKCSIKVWLKMKRKSTWGHSRSSDREKRQVIHSLESKDDIANRRLSRKLSPPLPLSLSFFNSKIRGRAVSRQARCA
jgi:hypothetical protein